MNAAMLGGPAQMPLRLAWGIVGVAAANLCIRGLWVAMVHPQPSSDYAWYFRAAAEMAAGGGYLSADGLPTAYWPVGWPFALSLLFRLTGPSVAAGLILQAVLSTLTAALVVVLAYRATGHVRAAVAGGVAYTVLPAGWAWDSQLGSEQLFTLLALTMLSLLMRADRWTGYLAAGVVGGLACLVRPVLLLFPVALLIIERFRRPGWRAAVAHVGAFSVALALTIAPWTLRNAVVLGSPVPVSTNGGVNLYQGTRTSTGYWWSGDRAVNPLLRTSDEVERNKLGARLALKHWLERPDQLLDSAPARMMGLFSGNAAAYWRLRWFGPLSDTEHERWRAAADAVYALVMGAATAGIVVAWRIRRELVWVLGGFAVYYTALWLFLPASDRFRFPLMPIAAVFAGVAVTLLPFAPPIANRQAE